MSTDKWPIDKLFKRLINNKSERSSWKYITILRSKPSEEVFIKSSALTKSENLVHRTYGIQILAQLGISSRPFLNETTDCFFKMLDTENEPYVISSILYGICRNNKSLSTIQLRKLSTFKDHCEVNVRQGLVSAMSGISNPIAIDSLIFLSTDKNASIRDWATFGLGSLIENNTKKIREALLKRVNDKDQDTRMEAIVGLARRKYSGIKQIIENELDKGEFGTLLFEAIAETNDCYFLPTLEEVLQILEADEEINPFWLNSLKDCIETLKSIKE